MDTGVANQLVVSAEKLSSVIVTGSNCDSNQPTMMTWTLNDYFTGVNSAIETQYLSHRGKDTIIPQGLVATLKLNVQC